MLGVVTCGKEELRILVFLEIPYLLGLVRILKHVLKLSMLLLLELSMALFTLLNKFRRNNFSEVLNLDLILVFQHFKCCESLVLILLKTQINEVPEDGVDLRWIFLELTIHNILFNFLGTSSFKGIFLSAKVVKTTAE